ncbi:MAG: prenyltransferase/squalene oxidase repeat-containing protein [Pirellulaceae bacterium]
MCSGSVPGDGPYGRNIDACVEYLLRNVNDQGYVAVQGGYDNMYGHGFATLFLSEAYGMTQNQQIREKLDKAVDLIVRCQNDQGGWRYQPQKSDADLSITICQIMALRAARDAGIDVPDETREKCIEYVKQSQNQDGSFRYTLSGGHGSFPLTAAGVVSLYSAGIYEGDAVEKGLKWLERQMPGSGGGNNYGYYFYGHYYAVQAMWHAGGDYWNRWYPAIRDELLGSVGGDGSWSDPQVGAEFGTAMACIILQMPLNYVPVFAA